MYSFFDSWEVLPDLMGDHRPIVTSLNLQVNPLPKRRFKTKNIPTTKFTAATFKELSREDITFKNILSPLEFDQQYNKFFNIITKNANKYFRKKAAFKQPKLIWWSPSLRSHRNKVRALYKKHKLAPTPEKLAHYRKERARYRKHILSAKKDAWVRFCQQETDAFGKTKKVAFSKHQDKLVNFIPDSNSDSPLTRSAILFNLTEHIFGQSNTNPSQTFQITSVQAEEPFSLRELRGSLFAFNKNKAPGPDNLDHNIVRALFLKDPLYLLDLFNSLFKLNYFPKIWKVGELVFFRKEGKLSSDPSSYRPITLLPILGKVFEKLILNRINYFLISHQLLSGLQHGFVDQRSTDTALQRVLSIVDINKSLKNYTSLISLDFKGAFDNLPWSLALNSLISLNIPQQLVNIIASFLSDRSARVDWLQPNLLYFFSKGCPQGSCLGPFLWLALLETLLKSFNQPACRLMAYADDLLLIVHATSRNQLELNGNRGIDSIQNWATLNKVTISLEKSLHITFGKPTVLKRPPIFKLQGQNIKSTKTLLYLGVTLDQHLTFIPHMQKKRQLITKITQNLFKFSSTSGRLPKKFIKIWYIAILQRQLAYASPIWFPRMWQSHGRRHLLAAQRRILLLMTRAYRNTSTNALQVLAGLPPLDIQLEAEAEFSLVTRLGVSTEDEFAPSYSCKCSKYKVSNKFKGLSITPSPLRGDIHIYTDGSKSEGGTGSAFYALKDNIPYYSWGARLTSENSVFQAELFAILKALTWASEQLDNSFTIFSDSMSGILALDKFHSKDHLVTSIQLLLQDTSKTFRFSWVKGHSGVEGNELADALARSVSTDLSVPVSFLPTPPSHLKYKLKQRIKQDWQLRWTSSGVGTYTREFIPNVSSDFQIQDRALVLFLTNHGPFQEHLFRINKSISPDCICGLLSNSLHYVLECTLTSHYHIKKPRQMSLRDWFLYLLDRPVLLQRIKQCMIMLEKNEHLFQDPTPLLPW